MFRLFLMLVIAFIGYSAYEAYQADPQGFEASFQETFQELTAEQQQQSLDYESTAFDRNDAFQNVDRDGDTRPYAGGAPDQQPNPNWDRRADFERSYDRFRNDPTRENLHRTFHDRTRYDNTEDHYYHNGNQRGSYYGR